MGRWCKVRYRCFVVRERRSIRGKFSRRREGGPGRHYYIKSKKIYDGEWHNDMAKCGVYSDMPKEFDSEPAKSDEALYTIRLPSLELKMMSGIFKFCAVKRVEDSRGFDI